MSHFKYRKTIKGSILPFRKAKHIAKREVCSQFWQPQESVEFMSRLKQRKYKVKFWAIKKTISL